MRPGPLPAHRARMSHEIVTSALSLAQRLAVEYRGPGMATTRTCRIIALWGVATVTLIIASAYAVLRIDHLHDTWTEAARASAYLSTSAFAEAAELWLQRRQSETIQRVAEVMISGHYRYVQVVTGGTPVVEAGDPVGPTPEAQAFDPSGSHLSIASVERRGSHWILDVRIPLQSLDGFVRTGEDVTATRATIAGASFRVVFACLGAWAAFSGSVWAAVSWVCRRKHRAEANRGSGAAVAARKDSPGSHLKVDPRTKSAYLDGKPLKLSPKQYALLALLASDEGRVFSDRDILSALWPESQYADSNDVRQCVYRLRRRMEATRPGGSRHISNEKGFGYCLAPRLPIPRARRTMLHERKGENHGTSAEG